MPINRDVVISTLQSLASSWRTPAMADFVKGAKTYAVNILVSDGASFAFAEQACEDAIKRGQLVPATVPACTSTGAHR